MSVLVRTTQTPHIVVMTDLQQQPPAATPEPAEKPEGKVVPVALMVAERQAKQFYEKAYKQTSEQASQVMDAAQRLSEELKQRTAERDSLAREVIALREQVADLQNPLSRGLGLTSSDKLPLLGSSIGLLSDLGKQIDRKLS